ncbi:hypothetical protein DFS34DRAFT_650606 [Phlyctochytrium arcticum]|nr:hypothetical protein DFS34DRAFT_650606 [Phlyctochytrium arcticum]
MSIILYKIYVARTFRPLEFDADTSEQAEIPPPYKIRVLSFCFMTSLPTYTHLVELTEITRAAIIKSSQDCIASGDWSAVQDLVSEYPTPPGHGLVHVVVSINTVHPGLKTRISQRLSSHDVAHAVRRYNSKTLVLTRVAVTADAITAIGCVISRLQRDGIDVGTARQLKEEERLTIVRNGTLPPIIPYAAMVLPTPSSDRALRTHSSGCFFLDDIAGHMESISLATPIIKQAGAVAAALPKAIHAVGKAADTLMGRARTATATTPTSTIPTPLDAITTLLLQGKVEEARILKGARTLALLAEGCVMAASALCFEGFTLFRHWKRKRSLPAIHVLILGCVTFVLLTEAIQARGQWIIQVLKTSGDDIAPKAIGLQNDLPVLLYKTALYSAARQNINTTNLTPPELELFNKMNDNVGLIISNLNLVQAALGEISTYASPQIMRYFPPQYIQALTWNSTFPTFNITPTELIPYQALDDVLTLGKNTVTQGTIFLLSFKLTVTKMKDLIPIADAGGGNLHAFYACRTLTSIFYGMALLLRYKLFKAIVQIPAFVFPTLLAGLFFFETLGLINVYLIWDGTWDVDLRAMATIPYAYAILLDIGCSSLAIRTLLKIAKDLNVVVLRVSRTHLIVHYTVLMLLLLAALALTGIQAWRPSSENAEWAVFRDVPFLLGFLVSFRFIFLFKAVAKDTAKGNIRTITVDSAVTYHDPSRGKTVDQQSLELEAQTSKYQKSEDALSTHKPGSSMRSELKSELGITKRPSFDVSNDYRLSTALNNG